MTRRAVYTPKWLDYSIVAMLAGGLLLAIGRGVWAVVRWVVRGDLG